MGAAIIRPLGNITFNGAVTYRSSHSDGLTVSNGTNNPSITIQGNITVDQQTGTLTWTKGTGTITLSGTSNQTITTSAGWTQVLEDLVVDKTAGRVTLAGDVYTDSFVFNDGDLNLAAKTITTGANQDVTINGNLGARFWNGSDEDMNDGTFVLGNSGDLVLNGAA